MENKILKGSIFIGLTKFSLPILFSLILQALYGAIDLLMVSHFADEASISAVSVGSQTMSIATGIITGLATGLTVLIGEAIGEKNHRKGRLAIGSSIYILIPLTILLTLILTIFSMPLSRALDAPEDALRLTSNYIFICGLGTIFVVGFNTLQAIFCGLGDSKTPLLFVFIAALVNILLDYILINKFQMGATGAAIATIVAQAASVIFSLIMIRGRLPFKLNREVFKPNIELILSLLRLGLPLAIVRMANELSYLFVLGLVNRLGVAASAGVGIAEKLILFILLIPQAYMQSISAYVAQNNGAGNKRRANRALWVGMLSSFTMGALFGLFAIFKGDLLSMIFISDPEIIELSHTFLRSSAIETIILSIAYAFLAFFNGTGHTTFVMLQGVLAAFLVRVPYAYYSATRPSPSIFNIGMAAAYSAIFMLVSAFIYYVIVINRARKNKRLDISK